MTIKELCESQNLDIDVVKRRAKRYNEFLKGHISEGRISVKSEIDEYAADILVIDLKKSTRMEKMISFADKFQNEEKKELKEKINEQQEIIERQSAALEEKDRFIKKLQYNYRILEMKFGNIYKESYYADKY